MKTLLVLLMNFNSKCMKNAGMKKLTTVLLAICLFLFNANALAQNKYMYIMKDGVVIKKQFIQPYNLNSGAYIEPAHAEICTLLSN